MIILRLVVVLACIASVVSIYETQLGEYDSLQKNIGLVKDAVHSRDGDKVYAITHDSVLACVDAAKGKVIWRVVLPEEASFEMLTISERDSKLFTLSKAPCGGGEKCQVYTSQGYELSNGRWLWDTHIATTTTSSASTGALDLAYISATRQLGVIAKNTLYNLNSLTGAEILKYTSGDTLQLAKVSVSPHYVALGCVTDSALPTAVCREATLLEKTKAGSVVSSASFAMPARDIMPEDLHLSIDLSSSGSFAASDAIFGSTSAGLSYIALASGKKGLAAFTSISGNRDYTRKGAFMIQDGKKGAEFPGAWRCSETNCQSIGVNVDAGGATLELASCSGDSPLIGFDRLGHAAHAVTRVMCASQDQDGKIQGVSRAVDTASAPAVSSESLVFTGASSTQGITHISACSSYNKNGESRTSGALLVGSAGTTTYHKTVSKQPSEGISRTLPASWYREEVLARIQEAILISRDHHVHSSADVDIRAFAQSMVDGVDELFDAAAATLLGKLGFKSEMTVDEKEKKKANKAQHLVMQAQRFGFDKLALCIAKGERGLVVFAFDVTAESVIWIQEVADTENYLNLNPKVDGILKLVHSSDSKVSVVFSLGAVDSAPAETRIMEMDVESGVISHDAHLEQRTLNVFLLEGEYLLLTEETSGNARSVLPFLSHSDSSDVNSKVNGKYVYHIDRSTGILQTYRLEGSVTQSVCTIANDTKQCSARYAINVDPVATAKFPPSSEKIVSVTSPTAGDVIASRTMTLKDDSVLLKYLNTNMCVVTTQGTLNGASALYVTVVDTVSAKIIYRSAIEGGSGPVSTVLAENNISIFYWNTKAKRSEVSSIHLYEGMVDKHGLTPFATKQSAAVATKHKENKVFSSYLSAPPLAMQKTYVMPKGVTAAHHTVTAHGVANKNVLVALTSGQIYMLDSRQISPRRPMEAPTQHEMMDGLQQFNPFLQFNPLQYITHNYALGNGAKKILSAPTLLESSSMAFSFGHPDVHFNRVLPSADFDLLGADFNYPLLTLLLGAIGFGVNFMQNKQRRNVYMKAWE